MGNLNLLCSSKTRGMFRHEPTCNEFHVAKDQSALRNNEERRQCFVDVRWAIVNFVPDQNLFIHGGNGDWGIFLLICRKYF